LESFIAGKTLPEEFIQHSKRPEAPSRYFSSPAKEFRILDCVHVQRQVGRNWIGRCPSCAAAKSRLQRRQSGHFRRGAAQLHLLGGLRQGDDPKCSRQANFKEDVTHYEFFINSIETNSWTGFGSADFTIGRKETSLRRSASAAYRMFLDTCF